LQAGPRSFKPVGYCESLQQTPVAALMRLSTEGGFVRITAVSRLTRALPSLVLGGALLAAGTAYAQVTPAAGYTPPDDTPKIGVGVTIFADYTYQDAPTIKDSDGNSVSFSTFEVRRAYINVTGQLNHLISFRITPDIASRLATSTNVNLPTGSSVSASTNYDGSLVFRLKYAFGQINLDEPLSHGSWVRFGQQQTPYIDFMEGIYRYRFQGTIFAERVGLLSSSDVGLSGHYNFPDNYGDVHVGFYNGDTYSKAEVNDQKAFQIRGTLRLLPKVLKGWRLTAFYDHDEPVKDGKRERFIANTTFEHQYVNLGFDYVDAKDRASGLSTKPTQVDSNGWSIWVTPRTSVGVEGLFRYDDYKPNKGVDAHQKRTLVGVAYWFKTSKPGLAAAILGDYEEVKYDTALNKPTEKRYELKTLFNY
jgi:hypothetical protein